MSFPRYITLKWNTIKDWSVIFSNKPRLDLSEFISTVSLRKIKRDIDIYGSIQDNYSMIIKNNADSKHITAVSLLKSNIQKAVRLGKVNEALISGLNLIQIDFISFIRRLIIICIEDVGVPSSLPLLVWLMMAYPNFELTNEIIEYLLLTLYSVCIYPTKHYPDDGNDVLEYEKYDYNDPYVNSLLIAGEYGGFKGDVRLFNRFVNSKTRVIIPIKIRKLTITRPIYKIDIIPSSVDFHCYPFILEELSIDTGLCIDTLKTLIWNNSSSINYRVPHNIVDKEVWQNVTKKLQIIQYRIIKKIVIQRI